MAENPSERIARTYFESEKVVSHYFREGQRVGLWNSEKHLFQKVFSVSDQLLDLGCGTGRISFGLEAMGFSQIAGVDFSVGMIVGATEIAESLRSKVSFHCADARQLPWEEVFFDGVIFGFNGFFMIPGNEERLRALKEIHRILKPRGRFVFTGHDRKLSNQECHWSKEKLDWENGLQDERKTNFGDVIEETDLGTIYIHSTNEIKTAHLLSAVEFTEFETWLRRDIGNEAPQVREFSDECRFWVARR